MELQAFRKVARSHVAAFLNAKDHVYELLGSRQNAESGRFREELLRVFLRKLLPGALSVDTGFIYGFEQVTTSDQIDIIIWDKASHSPVYDAGTAVIVPPEAVVAVISVKSRMTLADIESGLKNLMTVVPLDYKFRAGLTVPRTQAPLPPIVKFLVFYSQPDAPQGVLSRIATVMAQTLTANPDILAELTQTLATVKNVSDPWDPNWKAARRALPRLIATIEPGDSNFIQGWGPPFGDPRYQQAPYGPSRLQRLPWMYRSESRFTTALEKFVFLLLAAAFEWLESPALSTLSSWADLNPVTGSAPKDAEEIVSADGVPLIAVDG